jgi:UDP-N-acetylmuramate dehydrogenase
MDNAMSLTLEQNYDLKSLNTLGVPARAEYFCRVHDVDEVHEAIAWARTHKQPISILGGGSNVIMRSTLPGLCIQVALSGRRVQANRVSLAAGESWHQSVLFSLDQGLSGLENLALIPGQVGAAPIQNIGAYGVELAEHLLAVHGISLTTGEAFSLTKAECQFGYRDSVFKRRRDQLQLITEIELVLNQDYEPRLEYAGILDQLGNQEVTPQNVCRAVIQLREAKLPNPREVGNVGSFFKNPLVTQQRFTQLQEIDQHLVGYRDQQGIKLSAAYLIDQCGLKGVRQGGARVSNQHALVLENAGEATGEDVLALAQRVAEQVVARFGVQLEIEPRVLPDTT